MVVYKYKNGQLFLKWTSAYCFSFQGNLDFEFSSKKLLKTSFT